MTLLYNFGATRQLILTNANQNSMLNKRLFLLLPLVWVFTFAALLTAQERPQVASVVHDVHRIDSKAVNEQRVILVHTPRNYGKTNQKYPVVYMLDGRPPQPGMMGGMLEQQARTGKIPHMILVSIMNTDRTRDLTPVDDGRRGDVGGGDKFLDFLEKEVIPLIEKNYRTKPYRIFAGHSYGGLTVVYSFTSRPHLFNAYIAASPTLGFHNNYVIKEAKKRFEQKQNWNKIMFLSLANERGFKNSWNSFRKLLKDKKPKGFDYEFKEFPDETHGSSVLRAYYWGMRKIYRGY